MWVSLPGASVAGRDREAWKWACTHPKGASQLQSFVLAVTGDREEREASGARLQLRGLEDCRVKTIGAAFGKREKDGRQNYRFSLSRQVVESCGPGILKLGPQHSQWNNHHKATEAREMNSRIFFHIGKEMNSRIFFFHIGKGDEQQYFLFTSAREPNSRIFITSRSVAEHRLRQGGRRGASRQTRRSATRKPVGMRIRRHQESKSVKQKNKEGGPDGSSCAKSKADSTAFLHLYNIK
ncbi:uncharacterized protein [Excalfactoria chinensis]|uniref:uncharacterized protein n=1 Tax=Excalfactoria chinensis TaxID=46218 RepID=UPI003B3B28D2